MLTRRKALLLVVAAIAAGALAVMGWLVFAPSPGPFSAEEMLGHGRVNNSSLESYKFTMDARFTVHVEGGPERQEMHTDAVVVSDKGMYVKATEDGDHSETLLVDGTQYHRDSDAGPWEDWSSPGSVPLAPNFPSPRDHFQILESLTDVSNEGEEVLRGVRVNKIVGEMDMARQVREAWGDDVPAGAVGDLRTQMLAGSAAVTVWVGVEDGLLRAYTMEGSLPAVGEAFAYQYLMDVRFSHFNEPFELPSPNAAQ